MFGLGVPSEITSKYNSQPSHYWGARAIFQDNKFIDFVSDRQTCSPNFSNSCLQGWIKEFGLNWLEETKSNFNPYKDQLFIHEHGRFGIAANTHGSHGYLYVGAWSYHNSLLNTECQYELTEPTKDAKWTGNYPIYNIGDKVLITFNQLGTGEVLDYFVEYGNQGVRVLLDNPPDWKKKQSPFQPWAMVFGIETRPQKEEY